MSLREPLAPVLQDLGDLDSTAAANGRANGVPWTQPIGPQLAAWPQLREAIAGAQHAYVDEGQPRHRDFSVNLEQHDARHLIGARFALQFDHAQDVLLAALGDLGNRLLDFLLVDVGTVHAAPIGG
jgi:hypothetical protein